MLVKEYSSCTEGMKRRRVSSGDAQTRNSKLLFSSSKLVYVYIPLIWYTGGLTCTRLGPLPGDQAAK